MNLTCLSLFKIISACLLAWVNDVRGDKYSEEMMSSERIIYAIVFILIGIILWILNNEFGKIREVKYSTS